jgi:hypothetical protein
MTREIRILKKADDPLEVVRVSLGGRMAEGYYCVYRGSKEEAIRCLRDCLRALEAMAKQLGDGEPDISPDDGKRYA